MNYDMSKTKNPVKLTYRPVFPSFWKILIPSGDNLRNVEF